LQKDFFCNEQVPNSIPRPFMSTEQRSAINRQNPRYNTDSTMVLSTMVQPT